MRTRSQKVNFWPCLALLAGLFVPGIAAAAISLSKNVVDVVAADARRADIVVANTGEQTEQVRLSLYRVDKPGLSGEQRFSSDNPRELGIIATPRQFTLKPGERRKLRLSFLQFPQERDLIYRMLVEPVAVSDSASPEGSGNRISIVLSYNVLISLRPSQQQLSYTHQRGPNELTIHNTGNTNFLLYGGQQCNQQGEDCRALPVKRLYSQASFSFALPHGDTPAEFIMDDGGGTRSLSF